MWVMYNMARYPEHQDKVAEEIYALMGDQKVATTQRIEIFRILINNFLTDWIFL